MFHKNYTPSAAGTIAILVLLLTVVMIGAALVGLVVNSDTVPSVSETALRASLLHTCVVYEIDDCPSWTNSLLQQHYDAVVECDAAEDFDTCVQHIR